ncbi:MAG: DNA glycosylase [Candidatus Goldbacteria bacterium]|nr:DNA glycosylase [Candidatus Goldiibacteriota bacterium]
MSEYEDKINSVRKKLINWYKKNGRDFPWRHTSDPYKIMIAEFMLHRTRAEQVVPVYNDFIKRFPNVFALSKAKTEVIRRYTETLGLHWRYKHFIKSAKFIVEKCNGNFPDDYKLLSTVPGIGEYISCAISIIAFKKPAPVVDSNIARFVNRYYGLNLDGELRRKIEIVRIAYELFKYKYPDIFLFCIIDFASSICKPRIPLCKNCPVKKGCKNVE